MNKIKIKKFTFNPFRENTYLVYDKKGNTFIFDPGNSNVAEDREIFEFIKENRLNPVLLLNTHCHIDHIMGNYEILRKYPIPYYAPTGEEMLLESSAVIAEVYGVDYTPSPSPDRWIDTTRDISMDGEQWELFLVPGHSPASMVFYYPAGHFAISGDVLFRESIGRTDLPGGNHQDLLTNIREKLYTLPDDTIIFPGHGPETTIGYEKTNNPFVRV